MIAACQVAWEDARERVFREEYKRRRRGEQGDLVRRRCLLEAAPRLQTDAHVAARPSLDVHVAELRAARCGAGDLCEPRRARAAVAIVRGVGRAARADGGGEPLQ